MSAWSVSSQNIQVRCFLAIRNVIVWQLGRLLSTSSGSHPKSFLLRGLSQGPGWPTENRRCTDLPNQILPVDIYSYVAARFQHEDNPWRLPCLALTFSSVVASLNRTCSQRYVLLIYDGEIDICNKPITCCSGSSSRPQLYRWAAPLWYVREPLI